MIYIIHEMLLSLKNHLSYFKGSIFKCFSKVYNRLFLNNFFHNIMLEALRLEEESTIKGVRNRFRLKKELNYTEIKDVRNIFRLGKETKTISDRILKDIKNLFQY